MTLIKTLSIALPLLLCGAAASAYLFYRSGMSDAQRAWMSIASRGLGRIETFDPVMVADQPEIAQRYFRHAIAPGTPLRTRAELEMRGRFLLGDKVKSQAYSMTAREILRPPFEFLWLPVLRSGVLRITGSDGLADGRAWTRFWLAGLVPVANVRTSTDLLRSASFRAASESIWVPASLLPQNGVRWEKVGPDEAKVTITGVEPSIVLHLTLDRSGSLKTIVGQRWSNANRAGEYRLQPFGGTVQRDATFGGYTIPSRVNIGNHFGTDQYFPFFEAEIMKAEYR